MFIAQGGSPKDRTACRTSCCALTFEDPSGLPAVEELWRATIATLRELKGTIDLHWVGGHSGVEGNEEADKLAASGRRKQVKDVIDLCTPKELTISGMALENGSQQKFYKAIMAVKHQTPATKENLKEEGPKRI